MRGLEILSASIDEKSAELKKLVESNFERFVRTKATIDNVYIEMRNHGADERPGSRHTSWQNSVRTSGNRLGPGFRAQPLAEKHKNALIQESEYGTVGIQAPLRQAAAKAQGVWGPVLGGRDREEHLKNVFTSTESNKTILETGVAIEDCIKRRDYDTLTEEYSRAQRFRAEAQAAANRSRESGTSLTEAQIHQLLTTGRVIADVDQRIEDFKRDTWRRLTTAHFSSGLETPDGKQEEYMELISVLLQLGAQENPIWIWLQSRYDYLAKRIQNNFQHVRVELEIQRRRLLSSSRASPKILAMHLRNAEGRHLKEATDIDTRLVIRFWEWQTTSLGTLLSTKNGLLGELIEFWEIAQSFIQGMKQRNLPSGLDGSSKKRHRLGQDQVSELKNYALELFNAVREQLHGMFIEPPVEDVSAILSPSSATPKTPLSAVMSPLKNARFTFSPTNVPPLPSQVSANEPWQSYAFWPPHSNSLSSSTYLARLNNLIGTAAADVASVPIVKEEAQRLVTQLRSLVSDIRERSINAICAAWIFDSENCRELEDWTRSSEKPDLTNLPARFNAFELALLSNLQRIVYVPDAANHSDSSEVVLPPPNKHIDAVQKGFRNSLYKAFAGMMDHAARPSQAGGALESNLQEESIMTPLVREQTVGATGEIIDATNSNARKLLTISNFQTLRSDTTPQLFSTFESHFSATASDDAKTARDVLSQMYVRVFQAYVRPTIESLRELVIKGITSPTYALDGNRPTDAQPYVYDTLLALVLIHAEVSRTAPQLINQVLSCLLEQLSTALIDAFRTRRKYSLAALMQATLDVEFLAQTLDNYTTKKAGEVQGEIYQALDERTDNEARMKLQAGLKEMKTILKSLRERTRGEFGCFRRVRKRRGEGDAAAEN